MKTHDFVRTIKRSKNQVGSNGSVLKRKWYKNTFLNLLIIPVLFTSCVGVKSLATEITHPAHADYVSPLPKATPTPIKWVFVEQPKTEHDKIKAYINDVFQDDADKAFKLLSCENPTLDPEKINTAGNTPANSRDAGVFQISEYWQKVNIKFLIDWRTNVDMAYKLFLDNGKSFRLWSCSKKVGLN